MEVRMYDVYELWRGDLSYVPNEGEYIEAKNGEEFIVKSRKYEFDHSKDTFFARLDLTNINDYYTPEDDD